MLLDARVNICMTLAILALGCGRGQERPRQEQAAPAAVPVSEATGQVPVEPPDSEPAWLSADTMWTRDMPEVPWLVIKNIVAVSFVPSATQAERQAAIDLVHGKVVGGSRVPAVYWVLLPADRSGHTMVRAREVLRGLPQVRGAALR